MKDRLYMQIGSLSKELQVSTFHSFGLKLLRENYETLGYVDIICRAVRSEDPQTHTVDVKFIIGEGRKYHVRDVVIGENEMISLDKKVSSYLRYNALESTSDILLDQLTNFKTENYDDLDEHISAINTTVDRLNKQMRDAKESIEDAKKNVSLSDAGFGSVVSNIIHKERNPSTKIKTGIQFMNTMLNGGWEKGQLYFSALII